MVATRHANSPSDSWLLGATLSGYLIIAFVLRFWGEGLLFPASDIGYISGPPPESHPGLIVFVLIGVFITLLGILQTIFFVQGSEKLTRFSLWLNFLAIFCLGLAAFGTKWIEGPLDFIVLVVSVLAFFFGLIFSVVNILWGWLRRNGLRNGEPQS